MTVAGIGCRVGVTVAEVQAAVDAALVACKVLPERLDALATSARKSGEPALRAAAEARGLPLITVADHDVADAAPRGLTASPVSLRHVGAASVSEGAALAAAGPAGRLLAPRTVLGRVTAAIASDEASP